MPAWQQIAHQRQHEGEHQGDDGCREDRVGGGVDQHLADQRFPLALLLCLGMTHREMVQNMDELVGQMFLHHLIGRCGKTDHIRCKEGGDDTHCYHYRIEELADDAERQTQRGDDERKLTNLGHRETAAHRRLQRLASEHEAEGAEYRLTYQYRTDQGEDRNGIFYQNLRVYQHTYRYEEDGSEEILYRFYEFDNFLCLNGFCQYAAHDEGSEGAAEPHLGAQYRHAAAQTQRNDEQGFGIDEFPHRTQEPRNGEDAHDKPHAQEEAYLHDRGKHLPAVGTASARYRRQHHHHHDSQDIFQYQYAHHHRGKLLGAQPHIIECLIYNSGGAHGEHTAQEDAVHPSPAEAVAYADAQHHHAEHDNHGGDDGRSAHLHDFLEREVETEREEGEDDTDVGPGLDIRLVDYRHGVGHVWRNQESRHDVSQHQRLLEPLEDESYDACHHQDEGKVFY